MPIMIFFKAIGNYLCILPSGNASLLLSPSVCTVTRLLNLLTSTAAHLYLALTARKLKKFSDKNLPWLNELMLFFQNTEELFEAI